MLSGRQMLALAQSAIGSQTVELFRFVSRGPNAAGDLVANYAEPEAIRCNFQPVPQQLYAQYGLDFQKSYRTLVTREPVGDIHRGKDGDQVTFFGRRYNCESNTEWQETDQYTIVLCVDVGPA